MTFLNDKRKVYLLLLPFVFLIANALYFRWVTSAISDALLTEKYQEVQTELGLFATTMDAFVEVDSGWDVNRYTHIITDNIFMIDSKPMTFAAAYQYSDDALVNVSERHPSYEASPFDPLSYPGFCALIAEQDVGDFKVMFKPEGSDPREMLVHFRWIPTDGSLDGRYLVVVGISKYSISTQIPQWVSVGQWVSMTITFILSVGLAVFALQLGHIYDMREGDTLKDKYRDKR